MSEQKINTGGGIYIGGNINTEGGDFVGHDKNTTSNNHSVSVRGNVSNSNIVTGDHNMVALPIAVQKQYIQQIYEAIDTRENTSSYAKDDLHANIKEIQSEDEKGDEANEGLIAYRLENIKNMAPDILEVVLATIANPLAGFGLVVRKVAQKMKEKVEIVSE